MAFRIAISLAVFLTVQILQAQTITGSPERIWTDVTRKHTVVATLTEIRELEILLARKDNGREIKIPVAKLMPEDAKFVEQVRRAIGQKESLRIAADSLAKLRDLVDPTISLYEEPTPNNETSVQTTRRKTKHFDRLKSDTSDKVFTLFLEVADVRRAEIQYDPLFHPATGLESKEQRAKRLENENSFFEIDIVLKDYPITLPAKFRIHAGDGAKDLSVGSFFRLDCKMGIQKAKIGEFVLEYRNFKFPVSVTAFSVPDREEVAAILAEIKKLASKPLTPKVNPNEITRAVFRREFFRMDGADQRTISLVARMDLLSTFGPPSRTANIASFEYLIYDCIDGRVAIKVQRNVQEVVPEGQTLIISVDDY